MYSFDETLDGWAEKWKKVRGTSARSPPNFIWKHHWTADQTHDAFVQSLFAQLPAEVLLRIFQNINVSELAPISLVCRQFKTIADADEIWKVKCNSEFRLSTDESIRRFCQA